MNREAPWMARMNLLSWWRRRRAEKACAQAEADYYTRVVTLSAQAASLWESPMLFVNLVEARIVNRRADGSSEEVLCFSGTDGLDQLEIAVAGLIAEQRGHAKEHT